MKKIILGIFTMLSSITFANSNISGPKLYAGGGIGLGTQYIIRKYNGKIKLSLATLGLDLDANFGPIWTHKIDERNSIDFGPIFSLSLRNHAILDDRKTYTGQLLVKANMSFDYNLKATKGITLYLGSKLGFGSYIFWADGHGNNGKNIRLFYDILGAADFNVHTGIKLDNDTLRIGGSFGTKGLIFEVGKIF